MATEKIIHPPEFLKKDYPLVSTNRIKTGGLALYFAAPEDIPQLQKTLGFCQDNHIPFYILGNGSNVLISDDIFHGVVIKLEGNFKSVSLDHYSQTVIAGAGASLMKMGSDLAELGYTGFSYMGVIPGTVGGAVRMNAGIKKGQEIKNSFLTALVLDPDTGIIAEYKKQEMAFAYRESMLKKSKKIILQATFKLPCRKETQKHAALDTLKELLELRRNKHPKNPCTFGSTFKNPKNRMHPAGWYLEKVGMKGMQAGGAIIAEEHANWILNTGNAKTGDVKKLIETGQKRVSEKFGVQLEREVIYLPEDIEGWV